MFRYRCLNIGYEVVRGEACRYIAKTRDSPDCASTAMAMISESGVSTNLKLCLEVADQIRSKLPNDERLVGRSRVTGPERYTCRS